VVRGNVEGVFMWNGLGSTITGLFILGCATNALAQPVPAESFAKEQIGKIGYVTAREPVFFCPAPTVGFNGCRKLTAGKITITSTGHEAWLPNMGGGLKSPAELPGIREVLYGVKLNDKEDGFFHEESWKYLRSEQAHRAVLAEKAECDRRGGVKVGMTKAEVVATCWGKPKSINSTTTTRGTRQQWIYGRSYLYFDENGLLTTIQN
jgi:hypothetical protein